MKIVGLVGNSGVGKSTLAEMYFRPLGYLPVSLADDIKIRAVATGVASYEDVYVGSKPPHVRTWLQEEGTERGRHVFGDDVWLRSLFARLRRVQEQWDLEKFVIADVRFLNEARYIRANGGIVLRVEAEQRNAANGMTVEQRNHPSEREVDLCVGQEVDGVICNDPDDAPTVGWQVETVLYLNGLLSTPNRGSGLTIPEKQRLLRRMRVSGDYAD